MMENAKPKEENIIKNVRNIKEQIYIAIKDMGNLFRLEKETKAIKDKILWNIDNLFDHQRHKENYYKPVRISNFWNNNYIEYESNSDKNKTFLVEEYLNKIRPYLKDIMYNLKKPGKCKIQLTIANNFISSIVNDEKRVMHSKVIT